MLWDWPYSLLSFFVMQERRDAGVKGIARKEKSDALWRAFMESRKKQEKGGPVRPVGQVGRR
ncbi:MAG: hypothetical protein PHS41_08690 [Victivallaceae bacterium]|nr:hypothetical protein [Victivallaceae bacterium]